MQDTFGRTINYLRISVTDRCNLRCNYCLPDGICKVPMSQIMTYEQIVQTCKAAVSLGITRFKITGGEPLVRKGICSLVKMIKEIPGVEQVTITTNGILLKQFLPQLIEAGIDGINISLDTLDRKLYEQICGFDGLPCVLESIQACLDAGIKTKLNCVLQKSLNSDAWYELLNFVRDKKLPLRFIELMPIGHGKSGNGVNNQHLLENIESIFGEGKEVTESLGNGPAHYIKLSDFTSEIGFISAVNNKFCSQCNRIRLTSLGQLKSCLCFNGSVDLMSCFNEVSEKKVDFELRERLLEACFKKPQCHHFEEPELITEKKIMAQIGG